MAVEARRGCGYRKVGGLYLVGGNLQGSCCKLPIALHVCPTCGHGVRQTRGWTWIDPRPWLKGICKASEMASMLCPASHPDNLGERVGLLWIGRQFYPTPGHFTHEAALQGVSRRITAIPRGFVVGEHWVFLAHPEAVAVNGDGKKVPGVFSIFKPTAFEKLITETQARDRELMDDLTGRGIHAVVVPDDDRDHQGTVYDEADDDELPLGHAARENHNAQAEEEDHAG
jgi:hypothetical protein